MAAQNQKPPMSVKEVVHRLQLSLLDGISGDDRLFAAGSILSRSDYSDVVTERSLASLCGFPLCSNPLPSDPDPRPHRRYRISLREHRVYDLQESRLFCSPRCVVDSRTFEAGLSDQRCSVLDSARIAHVLALFGEREESELAASRLRIEERSLVAPASEELLGPSDAIEGYVPRRRVSSESRGLCISDIDFASIVVTEDEYRVSKNSLESQFSVLEMKGSSSSGSGQWGGESSRVGARNELRVEEDLAEKEPIDEVTEKISGMNLRSSLKTSRKKKLVRSVTWADEKSDGTGNGNLCEVRAIDDVKGKASGKMKARKSVNWGNGEGVSSKSMEGDDSEASAVLRSEDIGDGDEMLRFVSADACARALSEASEAVLSKESVVSDAMSEAGIIVLPPRDSVVDEEPMEEETGGSEPEQAPVKWPKKPEGQQSELFNPEDSWFDTPPDGFSLTLSAFAKMWNALFMWTTSSTLAYIYGRDESLHEEYLSVNGREYLQKVVLGDGRSSEIKQTLDGSLARALPGLAVELRLPTPVSSLEQAMGRLLETMSFVDALPSFRMKQWQVIVLLFIEALSVYRLPTLTPHMENRRILFHKVLDGAQITGEEYELMKDLMIPLGRAPHFSAQSGA